MLSKTLAALGVNVDVVTTRSRKFEPTSLFSLQWANEYGSEHERMDGIDIYRYRVTFSPPSLLGRAVSRWILRRWKKEEQQYGIANNDPRNAIARFYQRAISRPPLYDWVTMLALGPWSLPMLARILSSIKKYDILLVSFAPLALIWQMTCIARIFRKPVVILALFHPDDVYYHLNLFYQCFAMADAILAQTPYSTELFRCISPGSRPLQVGAGIDDKAFTDPEISGERFRAKHDLVNLKLVLFVGRKEPNKQYDLAVQAVDLIAHQSIRLVLIGEDVDGKAILSPNVIYLGKVSRQDLVDAYDACDIFLLPSVYESFGIVFLEAWMRKKPVIGNVLCHPVASIIRDGIDGYLCRDPHEIADRITTLISDPALAERLGEAGYQKVMQLYTWDVIGRKVFDLYGRIADGSWPSSKGKTGLRRLDGAGRE